jgi:integrase
MTVERRNRGLRLADWPVRERELWMQNVEVRSLFDRPEAPRIPTGSRRACLAAYRILLGFVAERHPQLLLVQPDVRFTFELIREFAEMLEESCSLSTIWNYLHRIAKVLEVICPSANWGWIHVLANRMGRRITRSSGPQVSSEYLFLLGVELMQAGESQFFSGDKLKVRAALLYRDGMMIAMLAAIPLRLGSLSRLRVGHELYQIGSLWAISISSEDTKTRRALEYDLSDELSRWLDSYVSCFRKHIPGADSHLGLWPGMSGKALCAAAIWARIKKRTEAGLGTGVSPHRFRHAAGTFWSVRDPENVLGAADLLGHASFGITRKHYIAAQSRIAGRALARILDRRKLRRR